MEAARFSLQSPSTPEAIVAQIRRQLTIDYPEGVDGRGNPIEPLAVAAVQSLWSGRVKTFVPVLALREVREVLREREGATATISPPAPAPTPAAGGGSPPPAPAPRDRLGLANDVFTLDEGDVLKF